jgi:hypothetical protein
MTFISIEDLSIGSKNAYEHREYLKSQGCKWMADYRAWVAPTVEDRDRIEWELEFNLPHSEQQRNWSWLAPVEEDLELTNDCEASPIGLVDLQVEVTYELCATHVGQESAKRYWCEELSEIVGSSLAQGLPESQIEEIWGDEIKGRSLSIALQLIRYFRENPLAAKPAMDSELHGIAAPLPVAAKDRDHLIDGKISVVVDKITREPIAGKVQFPYSQEAVFIIKRIYGRRWDSKSKSWLVPIGSISEVRQIFRGFQLSPRAKEILGEI